MGERDYILLFFVCVPTMCIPKVRKEREYFWRDSADWRDPVPPGSNQVEDLEGVPLEIVELKSTRVSCNHCVRSFLRLTSAISGVIAVLKTRMSAPRRDLFHHFGRMLRQKSHLVGLSWSYVSVEILKEPDWQWG